MIKHHQNAIAEAFQTTPRPELWVKLTQEQVDARRDALRIEEREAYVMPLVICGILGVFAFALTYSGLDVGLGAAALAAVTTSVMFGVIGIGLAPLPARIALEELAPLKENAYRCKRALKFQENPNVAAYRDKVVENGRELLVGDLKCMEIIFNDLDAERICRQAHGLPAI